MNTSKVFEPEMIVNPNTRKIYVPKELYNIAVRFDDNAEVLKIRIPRYFDDCDFADKICNIIYNNALGERGTYQVDERIVNDHDIVLSWYISNDVTKKEGKIYFVVSFSADVDNRGKSYYYSTLPAELNVLPSLADGNTGLDNIEITVIDKLLANSHNHTNKNILDTITEAIIEKIQSAYQHISNKLKHIPDGGRSGQLVGMNDDGEIAWLENTGGGNGSSIGTTNYNDLSNKPSINGVELNGDRTLNELGISIPTITFSGSYNDLSDKPKINNVELSGNLTLENLGITLPQYDIVLSKTLPDTLATNTIYFIYEEEQNVN